MHTKILISLLFSLNVFSKDLPELKVEKREQLPKRDLVTAVKKAIQTNPEIKSSELNIENSKLDIKSTRAAYMPHLSFSIGYTHIENPTPSSWEGRLKSRDSSVDLNQTLYDGGKVRALIKAAKELYKASIQNHLSTKNDIVTRTTDGFMEVLRLRKKSDIIEINLFDHICLEQLIEGNKNPKCNWGNSFESVQYDNEDLSIATSRTSAIETQLFKVTQGHKIAELEYENLVDENPEEFFFVDIFNSLIPNGYDMNHAKTLNIPYTNEEAYQLALTKNPDVVSMKNQIVAKEYALSATKKAWMPELNLFASYNNAFQKSYDFDDYNHQGSVIGVNLTWNIYTGGERKAQILQSKNNLNIGQYDLEVIQRNLKQNIYSIYETIEQLSKTKVSLLESIEALQESTVDKKANLFNDNYSVEEYLAERTSLAQAKIDLNDLIFAIETNKLSILLMTNSLNSELNIE